jgi:hypothetical protein
MDVRMWAFSDPTLPLTRSETLPGPRTRHARLCSELTSGMERKAEIKPTRVLR